MALVLLIEAMIVRVHFWKGAEMVTKKDKLCGTFRKKRWLIVANDGSQNLEQAFASSLEILIKK